MEKYRIKNLIFIIKKIKYKEILLTRENSHKTKIRDKKIRRKSQKNLMGAIVRGRGNFLGKVFLVCGSNFL